MSTHNIQFCHKIRKFSLLFVLSYRKKSVGTQKWVQMSHGKRAIGVRAIEVRLYILCYFIFNCFMFLDCNTLYITVQTIWWISIIVGCTIYLCRPRWLSWMRRPTGDQEVAGSTPAEVSNILLWRLIMKYFLLSFSPLHWFKKGSCRFLAKECAQYWLTA